MQLYLLLAKRYNLAVLIVRDGCYIQLSLAFQGFLLRDFTNSKGFQMNQNKKFSEFNRTFYKTVAPHQNIHWKPSYCMRTDGRTDGRRTNTTNLTVEFRKFSNAPKI
jgi:hypothetical protein